MTIRKPVVEDFERLNIFGLSESDLGDIPSGYDLILELNDMIAESIRTARFAETDKERRFYEVRTDKLKTILGCVVRDIGSHHEP